jgi:hypothetical protein
MRWSFGIITPGGAIDNVNNIIASIVEDAGDHEVEILVIGGNHKFDHAKHIPFDEDSGPAPGWFTRKKNIIALEAKYNNLCILHDYLMLRPGWFDGFEKFDLDNPDWMAATNQIFNKNGSEFRSWAAVFQDAYRDPIDDQKPPVHLGLGRKINPKINTWGRWQYYSGAYYVIKRHIMIRTPMDETLCQNQGEDISWSRSLYHQYGQEIFAWNPYSSIEFLKQKDHAGWESLPQIDFDYG